MRNCWRVAFLASLVVLAGSIAADAQTQAVGGSSGAAAVVTSTPAASPAPSASVAAAAAAMRRRPSGSFNRVVTAGRASASTASRATYGGSGAPSYGPTTQGDPLRPYSPRVREASAAVSTTRPQEAPRVAVQRPVASYNYYPGMRSGLHPNANTAQIRSPSMGVVGMPHRCTPSRGQVMAGSLGRGR